MSKFCKNDYPKGTFKLLDKMNEKTKNTWFLHRLNKIIYDISFVPGNLLGSLHIGGTFLYYLENEFDDENIDAIFTSCEIINEYLVSCDVDILSIDDTTHFEKINNPNPSKELTLYLRSKKLERIKK